MAEMENGDVMVVVFGSRGDEQEAPLPYFNSIFPNAAEV